MSISVKEAQRLGYLPKSNEPTKSSKPTAHPLTKRIAPICALHGWSVDVYRTYCTLPESPRNTAETTAKPNAVVLWRDTYRARVVHLGWLWDVEKMSDDDVVEKLKELETQS
jgi:hypothetical protein